MALGEECVDFLLDRIAHEEAVARAVEDAKASSRLVAQCDARQRIVRQYQLAVDVERDGLIVRRAHPAAVDALGVVLRTMANAYSEHPDFPAELPRNLPTEREPELTHAEQRILIAELRKRNDHLDSLNAARLRRIRELTTPKE